MYLLRDDSLFDLDKEHQGRVTTTILLVAIIVGICYSFIAGYIYDYFQRKIPMFAAVLFSAVFLFFCPMTAPSVAWLIIDRSLIQVCIT